MSIVVCPCGEKVDTDYDTDALDQYGEAECKYCRRDRMGYMWAVMNGNNPENGEKNV